MKLCDNVNTLKNVGDVRVKKLNKLGVFTIRDLITHYPRDYMDRSVITKISEIEAGQEITVLAEVVKTELTNVNNLFIVTAILSDETGKIQAIWFNQPYLKKTFKEGVIFTFTGKASLRMNKLVIESPDYELFSEKELLKSGRIVPLYPSTDKLSQNLLRSVIKTVLDTAKESVTEFLPDSILNEYKLCSRLYAIENIHFPKCDEAFAEARKRLVFEELFLMQLSLFHVKGVVKRCEGYRFENCDTESIEKLLTFQLTNAQKDVIKELKWDFKSGCAMNRLVQGDVGSGKTIVAIIGCVIASKNGCQSAVMAPTEVLAVQHMETFAILEQLGLRIALLIGSLKKKEKDLVKQRLKNGEIDIIIGTHALIQETVHFQKLGFVVTDEQHRFGVRQRAMLSKKSNGLSPHTLVMTATPIPRTLALILYGDLDVSAINELPPGRQKIDTSAVTSSYHKRIFTFIQKQIDEGRQAYIICPSIESSETANMRSVLSYKESLEHGMLQKSRIACLHGKMKNEEKQSVMQAFAKGDIDALVATTVVEVGVNVPNATVILIENADRFGLSQLHQLRGRVGRGKDKSYCILVSDSKSDATKQRLKAMTTTNDGFEIAEMDLALRGPGEFFGTRQHGLPEMKIANLYKDMDYLKLTQIAAMKTYENGEYTNNRIMDEICTMSGDSNTILL